MKIKFIGVPGEAHDSVSQYGYTFPRDKFVEVHEPVYMRKLSNHPHFVVKPGEEIEDAKIITAPDGKNVRADLEALALAAGVERIDKRWSDETLQEKTREAVEAGKK